MAKPLREPPPSSSVAKLFDMQAAARAVATPPPMQLAPEAPSERHTEQAPSASQNFERRPQASERGTTGEQPHIKRELVLTATADQTFSRLVELYRGATASRLTASHVARAMMKGIAHCMDEIEREATKLGPMRLPSNARGREQDRERFEARIADAFVAGIRRSAAFDSTEQ